MSAEINLEELLNNWKDCQDIDLRGKLSLRYLNKINSTLKPNINSKLPVVADLFAGCGGLSLGFEAAGFKTIGYEIENSCIDTYNHNLAGQCYQKLLDESSLIECAEVIIGGPPCQPFSVRGKQAGSEDSRNGFPAFVAAIKTHKPDIWLFENVRGVFFKNKSYIENVIEELQNIGYIVDLEILNAVNYNVPQNRERVFVCGHKGNFKFPKPFTYKLPSGVAVWDLIDEVPDDAKFLTQSQDKYIATYEAKSKCIRPRDLHLELPARTLTCRNLAGATSDMHRVLLPDGRRRRLTAREAARLQSFPDWFKFFGNQTNQFNQIGNAVPPLIAYYIALEIKKYVMDTFRYSTNEIIAINANKKVKL